MTNILLIVRQVVLLEFETHIDRAGNTINLSE